MTLYLEGPANTFSAWRGTPINGVWYPRDIESKWAPKDLAGIGLYAPLSAEPVPEGKRSTGRTVQRVNGDVKFVHALEDMPEPSKSELLGYAAELRWQKEISGIEINGAQVMTDRVSQSLISGAFSLVRHDPETVIDFKMADGWAQLDAVTMTALAVAVGKHIQACFALEKAVAAKINAGEIATHAEVDREFE